MRTYSPKASEIQRVWYIVDAEGLEQRRLHVARAERLVEIPDAGEHVASSKGGFLGLHGERRESQGRKVVLAAGVRPHSID